MLREFIKFDRIEKSDLLNEAENDYLKTGGKGIWDL